MLLCQPGLPQDPWTFWYVGGGVGGSRALRASAVSPFTTGKSIAPPGSIPMPMANRSLLYMSALIVMAMPAKYIGFLARELY